MGGETVQKTIHWECNIKISPINDFAKQLQLVEIVIHSSYGNSSYLLLINYVWKNSRYIEDEKEGGQERKGEGYEKDRMKDSKIDFK